MDILPDGVNQDVLYLVATCSSIFVVTHLAWIMFFAWKDLSGSWAKYALEPPGRRRVSWATYWDGIKNYLFDSVVFFVPTCTAVMTLHCDRFLRSRDPVWLGVLRLALGYVLGRVWSYCVHRALPCTRRFTSVTTMM